MKFSTFTHVMKVTMVRRISNKCMIDRAVLVVGENQRALTRDHTPDSESNRVRALGFLSTELLKDHFTPLEFRKRPLLKELGSMVLYREPYMTGWAYKILAYTDLKLPLISGHGKTVITIVSNCK